MIHPRVFAVALLAVAPALLAGQGRGVRPTPSSDVFVLRPARVFDGDAVHDGWAVRVKGERIDAAGPAASIPAPAGDAGKTIDLPGLTLLPGLVEGHSHVLLHPYNETTWNDQVAHESLSLRVARATNHLRNTLLAGFTTIRDLGTEGAGYADVGLKEAIEQGIIPGPRMLVSTRAIVATGSYGPKGYASDWNVPQGAEEADGVESTTRIVRSQIGRGAEWIKFYADYRWGPLPGAHATFTPEVLAAGVQVAHTGGTPVSAHASSVDGMRNAILAGVDTIEHGDSGTAEIFKMMAERHVVLCPTLAAGDATSRMEKRRTGGAARHRAQARQLQGGTRCGRDDPQRQRCRRVHARRERARARADGELRDACGGRAESGNISRRPRAAHGDWSGEAGNACGSHRSRW